MRHEENGGRDGEVGGSGQECRKTFLEDQEVLPEVGTARTKGISRKMGFHLD